MAVNPDFPGIEVDPDNLPGAPLIHRVWGMNPNLCCCEPPCCGVIDSFNASFSYRETSGLSNITISVSGSLSQVGGPFEAVEVAGDVCVVGSADGDEWSIGAGTWSNADAGTDGVVRARIEFWDVVLDCSGCGVVDIDFVVSVIDDGAVIDSRTISFSFLGACIDQDFSANRSIPKPGGGTITEAGGFRMNSGDGWQKP